MLSSLLKFIFFALKMLALRALVDLATSSSIILYSSQPAAQKRKMEPHHCSDDNSAAVNLDFILAIYLL